MLLHSTSSTNGAILDELLGKWEDMGYEFGVLTDLCSGGMKYGESLGTESAIEQP